MSDGPPLPAGAAQTAFEELAAKPKPAAGLAARFSGRLIEVEDMPGIAMRDLRLQPGDTPALERAEAVLGFALPIAPRTIAKGGGVTALWLSIDQWLIVGNEKECAALDGKLRKALKGQHFALTDVSAMRVGLRLRGDEARAVLSKCCPVDMHAHDIKPGFVRRITFGEIAAVLHMADAKPDVFELFVFRSYLEYALDWLDDATHPAGRFQLYGAAEAPPV